MPVPPTSMPMRLRLIAEHSKQTPTAEPHTGDDCLRPRSSRSPRTAEVGRLPVRRIGEQRLAGVDTWPVPAVTGPPASRARPPGTPPRDPSRAPAPRRTTPPVRPAATSSPSARCRVKPSPSRCTVSMPRWTSTPDPVGGEHDERVRVHLHELARDGGDDRDDPGAVGRLDRDAGPDDLLREHRVRHARPRPGRPPRDRRGDRARSQKVLDVVGERVGLGADDDLHDVAGDEHAVRAGASSAPPRRRRRVVDLGAQASDAALDLDDVACSAEPGDDVAALDMGSSLAMDGCGVGAGHPPVRLALAELRCLTSPYVQTKSQLVITGPYR